MAKIARNKVKILSINPGSGVHLGQYLRLGADVRLALEIGELERAQISNNLDIRCENITSRKFYNRKQKGTDDLLAVLKLKKAGDLDVLDISSELEAFEHRERPQNLYDSFGIARRLKPKIVIAYGPASLLQNTEPQRFHSFLDYLRYDSLTRFPRNKDYFVHSTLIDASNYGAGVSKGYTLIVGIRSDIAQKIGIKNDQSIEFLLPRSTKVDTVASTLGSYIPSNTEAKFWALQTRADRRLAASLKHFPKQPTKPFVFSPSLKEKRDIGLPKSWISTFVRASVDHPIPDPNKYSVVHPSAPRLLALSEMREIFGLPKAWKFKGSDTEAYDLLAHSIPVGLADAVYKSVVKRVLVDGFEINEADDPTLRRITQAETLLESSGEVRTYAAPLDIGFQASCERITEVPSYDDFDFLFDANEINEDFVVYGPYDPEIGRRPVVGAVHRGVFKGKERRRVIGAIEKVVKDKQERRANCAVVPIPQETLDNLAARGKEYELSQNKCSYRILQDPAENRWGLWTTHPMPSVQVGWSKDLKSSWENGRGKLKKSKNLDDPKDAEIWDEFNHVAEKSYRKLAWEDYLKQSRFMRTWMTESVRLGKSVFTTMSVQKYDVNLPAMAFHIDEGNEDSGLTTITVFDSGKYSGGFFVLPRYRCAFRVGDGDVFVANSRQVHGVSETKGRGNRYSVVSYTKTKMAFKAKSTKALAIRSPRPNFRINQYQIAIPSFMRDQTLVKKTLKVLEKYKIKPNRVTIFMANEAEREKYAKALKNSPYQNLVVAKKGIKEVRNFMWNYYPEGTPVLFMDDDIEEVQILDGPKDLVPVTDLYEEVIKPGFHAMRENHAYIWGIYAAGNAFYMSGEDEEGDLVSSVTVGHCYIIGSFFGAIIRHDPKLLVGTDDKEDNERSVLHYIKDGRVVRLDYATVKSAYYTEQGGLQETRTKETVKKGADYMLRKYPKYVAIF